MQAKARDEDMDGRIREICLDPTNQRIERVSDAGQIIDGHLVTHNGLLVKPTDPGYVQLLQGNRGCHEPQEEYVFQEVLPHIPRGGVILELGAYWAFYSMWFAKSVADAQCYLVEPRKKNLKLGKYNFAKNGMKGRFFQGRVGDGYFNVDSFMKSQQLEYVDVLHADIQGTEYAMLHGAEHALRDGKIGYIFVGTHSQKLHYQCKAYLESHGYLTIAHADYEFGTYCCDGVLVARHANLAGLSPLEIPLRDAERQYAAERTMADIQTGPPVLPQQRPLRRLWQSMASKVIKLRGGDRVPQMQ